MDFEARYKATGMLRILAEYNTKYKGNAIALSEMPKNTKEILRILNKMQNKYKKSPSRNENVRIVN